MQKIYKIIVLAVSGLTAFSINAAVDPCVNEADKISCIQALIAVEQASIEARINYLNTTPGVKGDKGPVGDKGATGPKGDTGVDSFVSLRQHVDAYFTELNPVYIDFYNTYQNVIWPAVSSLSSDIDSLFSRFSQLNRNPDLYSSSTSSEQPGYLAYPSYLSPLGGWYGFSSIEVVRNGQNCVTTLNNTTVSTVCGAGTLTPTVTNVCTSNMHMATAPSYCQNTVTSIDLSNLVINVSPMTNDELLTLSTKTDFSDFQVISLNEWANYKLGMNPNDPVYLMALNRILTHLEDSVILADILNGIDAAMAKAPTDTAIYKQSLLTQINTLQIAGDPDNQIPVLQAKYDSADADLADTLVNLAGAINVTNSLADPKYGNRLLRLGEYAVDSDIMYYLVVETTIDVYLDYLYDLTFRSGLTQAQLDAFTLFEEKFMVFASKYMQRWQDIARSEKEHFFATNYSSSFEQLFASPTTPDFVNEAALKLSGEYDSQQSYAVRGWHEAMIAGGVTAGAFAATFAASAATVTSIATTAAANVAIAGEAGAVGINAALGGAGFTSSLGAAGSIGVVAGPAAVITAAVTIAIVQGIAVADQSKKDKRYVVLQDINTVSMTINDLKAYFAGPDEKDLFANILYLWLMIDNPRSVSNSSSI